VPEVKSLGPGLGFLLSAILADSIGPYLGADYA
jgi:hypothetical protein